MAWTDIPIGNIAFGLFAGAPGATVTVAPADLLLFRYKELAKDTLVVDFKIGKAFLHPNTASAEGITMALNIPFTSMFFPAIGAPSTFMNGGQTYSNDCVINIDPGSLNHEPGCVVVLNEASHKLVLMVRNINGTNLNSSSIGVFGFFGQITFEVTPRG